MGCPLGGKFLFEIGSLGACWVNLRHGFHPGDVVLPGIELVRQRGAPVPPKPIGMPRAHFSVWYGRRIWSSSLQIEGHNKDTVYHVADPLLRHPTNLLARNSIWVSEFEFE